MQDDCRESGPGTLRFWQQFYGPDGVVGSDAELNAHYEWFMEYEDVKANLLPVAVAWWKGHEDDAERPDTAEGSGSALRILHVGCGNSDFADRLGEDLFASQCGQHPPVVLNMDACVTVIEQLKRTVSKSVYEVGDCCNMRPPTDSVPSALPAGWFGTQRGLLWVADGCVDILVDKGTLDALLSAFTHIKGQACNPNAVAHLSEVARCLWMARDSKPGGLYYLLSINGPHVIMPYIYSISCERTVGGVPHALSLTLMHHETMNVPQRGAKHVCTHGQLCNLYAFQLCHEPV